MEDGEISKFSSGAREQTEELIAVRKEIVVLWCVVLCCVVVSCCMKTLTNIALTLEYEDSV